jgi:hypothetical protein
VHHRRHAVTPSAKLAHIGQNALSFPVEFKMADDPRCCGSGTCIINVEGQCWCGQQWNGRTMCHPPPSAESLTGNLHTAPSSTDTSERELP